MKIGKLACLVALCSTVALTGSAVPQSIASARPSATNLNLGLATDQPIWQVGTTAVFNVQESAQGRDLNGDGVLSGSVLHVFDATTGEVRNLGLMGDALLLMNGRLVVFGAWESEDGPVGDLNGDGDTQDAVLHVYDTARRSLTNLRVAARVGDPTIDTILEDGGRLVFSVDEESQGRDLNGDGDQFDRVVHLFDVATGRLQNTGLAVFGVSTNTVAQDDRWIAVAVDETIGTGIRESGQNQDLNGDGDATDSVLHAFDTATRRVTNLRIALNFEPFRFGFKVGNDEGLVVVPERAQGIDLNGDQDLNDFILHSVDVRSGQRRNTGISVFVPQFPDFRFDPVLLVQQGVGLFSRLEADVGRDLNGDGDTNDTILHVLRPRTGQLRSLNLAAQVLPDGIPSGRAVLNVSEQDNGKDLNGDGVQDANILFLADLRGNEPRLVNTGRRAAGASNGEDVVQTIPPADPFPSQIQDSRATFIVSEAAESNRDLNGDGDAHDFLLHIADLATGTTRNTGLSGAFAYRGLQSPLLPPDNGSVVLPVREDRQGKDLNGDGDLKDMVLQIIDVRTGNSRSTGFAIASVPTSVIGFQPFSFLFEIPLLVRGQGFQAALVLEDGVDLNSDGDTEDLVLHFFDLATGKVTNTGLAAGTPDGNELGGGAFFAFAGLNFGASLFFSSGFQLAPPAGKGPGLGDAFAFLVSEAAQGHVDLNGDGDTDDLVVHATRLTDRDRNGRFDFAEVRSPRSP